MNQDLENKKERVYNQIMELEEGNERERLLAFDCMGILGNEFTDESYENRLNIVENLIHEHVEKKDL